MQQHITLLLLLLFSLGILACSLHTYTWTLTKKESILYNNLLRLVCYLHSLLHKMRIALPSVPIYAGRFNFQVPKGLSRRTTARNAQKSIFFPIQFSFCCCWFFCLAPCYLFVFREVLKCKIQEKSLKIFYFFKLCRFSCRILWQIFIKVIFF